MTDTTSEDRGPNRFYREKTVRVIAGRSLDEWKKLARQDNCLDVMVPSDLRQILEAIT
jgi:hypothetical protein